MRGTVLPSEALQEPCRRGHGAAESQIQSSGFLPLDSQLGVTCSTNLSSWVSPSFHPRAPAPCDRNA